MSIAIIIVTLNNIFHNLINLCLYSSLLFEQRRRMSLAKFKRDLKKQLRKEINRITIDKSNAINNGGDATMLNKMYEEVLIIIFDGNESLSVQGEYSVFP